MSIGGHFVGDGNKTILKFVTPPGLDAFLLKARRCEPLPEVDPLPKPKVFIEKPRTEPELGKKRKNGPANRA